MKSLSVSILEKILLAVVCLILLFAPFSKHPVKILYYSGLVLWLTLGILKYRAGFYKSILPITSLEMSVIGFFMVTVISTVLSRDFYHSQEILFQRYLPYIIVFFLVMDLVKSGSPVVINFRGRKMFLSNSNILTGTILLACVILGAGGILDYFRFRPSRLWTAFGMGIGCRMLPVYLVYFIPFNAGIFIRAKSKFFRAAGLISFSLLFIILILNGSRGAFLAVIISSLLMALFSKRRKYMFFLLFLVIIALSVMPRSHRERMKDILHPFAENTFVERKNLFNTAGEVFRRNPFFGAGVGMYEVFVAPEARRTHLHAHNTYLELLCETGLAGLAAFLWIFAVFFKKVLGMLRTCGDTGVRAVQTGLAWSVIAGLVFALSCTIMTVGFQSAVVFWILFGISSGLIHVYKDNRSVAPGKIKRKK